MLSQADTVGHWMPCHTALLSQDGKTDDPCLEHSHHPVVVVGPQYMPMGKMPKLCLCRELGLLRSLAWEILLTQPFSITVLLMWLEQHCLVSLQREPRAACRREGEGIV